MMSCSDVISEEVVSTEMESLEPASSSEVYLPDSSSSGNQPSKQNQPFTPTHTDITQVTYEEAIETESSEVSFNSTQCTTSHSLPIESDYVICSEVITTAPETTSGTALTGSDLVIGLNPDKESCKAKFAVRAEIMKKSPIMSTSSSKVSQPRTSDLEYNLDLASKVLPESSIENLGARTKEASQDKNVSGNALHRQTGTSAVVSEARLQEAELIINLSSRSRRSTTKTTIRSQAKTSHPVDEALSSSDVYTSTQIPTNNYLSGNVVNMEPEGVIQVSSTDDVIMENAESSVEQSNFNENVVVISMNDEATSTEEIVETEPAPSTIFIPSKPHSLFIINKQKCESSGLPEITIERKKVHECIVCKVQFKSIMDLFRHRVEHNDSLKNSFKCDKCEMVFTEPMDLEKHTLSHLDQRLYQCSICQDTFTLLHNYKCHLRIHSNAGPYVCNQCYRVFDKKSQFISHMDDHEFASVNPYRHRLQCTVCDKIFSDTTKLKRHLIVHNDTKEFKCDMCPKEFFERHKLARHMLIHTGRRDYQCPHCERSFALKHNLTTHIRIHENIRPYQCFVCKKSFIQKIVLQRHLRIHQDYLIEQSQRFSQRLVNQ